MNSIFRSKLVLMISVSRSHMVVGRRPGALVATGLAVLRKLFSPGPDVVLPTYLLAMFASRLGFPE